MYIYIIYIYNYIIIIHKPYGSKYLLRKCLGYNFLSFGGLAVPSQTVLVFMDP